MDSMAKAGESISGAGERAKALCRGRFSFEPRMPSIGAGRGRREELRNGEKEAEAEKGIAYHGLWFSLGKDLLDGFLIADSGWPLIDGFLYLVTEHLLANFLAAVHGFAVEDVANCFEVYFTD